MSPEEVKISDTCSMLHDLRLLRLSPEAHTELLSVQGAFTLIFSLAYRSHQETPVRVWRGCGLITCLPESGVETR